ncbi:MAG TPA: hypothetical protein VHE30_06685 [Polyangiaceae bacterium]|nr:hypothetical protein [Polyangiaceae bacterium]
MQSQSRALRALRALFGGMAAIVLVGAAPSCGGSTAAPGTDSNTHWLDQCQTSSDCGGLECRCGVCTAACAVSGDCTRFSADAVCERTCASEAPSCVRRVDGGPGPSECPTVITSGAACDSPTLVCPTPCVGGFYSKRYCGTDGRWVAGLGLFPCGPDGGTPVDGGSAPQEAGTKEAGAETCAPEDAHDGLNDCAQISGYAWDGEDCVALRCGCTGADCARTYSTRRECETAKAACFAARGISFSCETSADCTYTLTTCCGPCGPLQVEDMRAMTLDSIGNWNARACSLPVACQPVCVNTAGTLGSVCDAGHCVIRDFGEFMHCTAASDCHLAAKDCCACGALQSSALVALSNEAAYFTSSACPASCPACPGGITSLAGDRTDCDTQSGACTHIYGD